MKILLRLPIIIAFLAILFDSAQATYPPDGSAIPSAQWETHTEGGIAVSIQLHNETGTDNRRFNYMVVYIKNISTTDIYFGVAGGHIIELKIFYTDNQNIKHYLRDYHPVEINSAFPVTLTPGQIFHEKIGLNAYELTFVVSHPIQCTFFMGTSDGSKHEIITSPKQLYTQ